jgi:hypothetical protein
MRPANVMNTRCFLLSVIGLAALVAASRSSLAGDAPESRLTAELVWGTNGDKPSEKDFKPISPDLEKRLHRTFKWKNYLLIERKDFAVPDAKTARVEMSKECRLEVTRSGAEEYEIQLFGKGKLVIKKRQRIVAGESIVLGGDDKNDDAWFVVVALSRK